MDMLGNVRETISRYKMIPKRSAVIVCLSGGADSVCLLRVLNELKDELDISLTAIHINHCLRGDESDRDMKFCLYLCQKLHVSLTSISFDVKSFCEEYGCSLEEGARIVRYAAFEDESKRLGNALIATAHNKGDSCETVIFNLARGTGIRGLRGIPPKRDNIIRPLLNASREDIEEYLGTLGQDYVTDSTNLTEDYSRNLIRHRIIPVLKELNPSLFRSVSSLSECAAEDEEYFEQLISDIPHNEICKYPPSVRKRYIRKRLTESGAECSAERIRILDEMMVSGKDTSYNLKGRLFAYFSKGVMEIKEADVIADREYAKEISLDGNSEINIPEFDKTVIIRRFCNDISCENHNIQKKLTNHLVNCDKIQGVAVLRNKRDGDKIRFPKRGVTTKLKKHFNALGLSEKERKTALVMEDEAGIFWCEYGGVCERVCPDSTSDGNISEIIIKKDG